MKPKKLSYKKFLESFKLAPRLAVDLWLKREDGALLYTIRDNEPYTGKWHLPGTFLLVGESINNCLARLALEELGLKIQKKSLKLRALDEDLLEPRGHVIHLVYEVRVKNSEFRETQSKKFFFEPPQNIIKTHRSIIINSL